MNLNPNRVILHSENNPVRVLWVFLILFFNYQTFGFFCAVCIIDQSDVQTIV